jgi:hypothetical protein
MAQEERRRIVQYYSDRWTKPPGDVQLPPPLDPPIKELGEPLNGMQCTADGCTMITVNRDRLRKHCKKEHGLL